MRPAGLRTRERLERALRRRRIAGHGEVRAAERNLRAAMNAALALDNRRIAKWKAANA